MRNKKVVLIPILFLLLSLILISVGLSQVQKVILGNVANPNTRALTIVFLGTGTGQVTADPGGTFTSNTSIDYPLNSNVTLTASGTGGSLFLGWSGDCSGSATCNLIMNENKTVYASFYNYDIILTAESQPANQSQTDIVKRNYSDLSEALRVNVGNVEWPGNAFLPDVEYLPETGTISTWSQTISNTYNVRTRVNIAIDSSNNVFYVSLGSYWTYDGNAFIIWKRSLANGSSIWTYTYPAANSDLRSIYYYDNSVYGFGQYMFGYAQSQGKILRRYGDNSGGWMVDTIHPSGGSADWRGGAVYADSTGVYVAYLYYVSPSNYYWTVEKRGLSGGALIWSKTETGYGYSAMPFKILSVGDYIYVFGGLGRWIAEKRSKSDGTRLYYRVYNTGGSAAIVDSLYRQSDNLFVSCGTHSTTPNYQVRVEKQNEIDFSTITYTLTSTRGIATGISHGSGSFGSVIVATPTYNSSTGKADVLIQKRRMTDLGL